LRKEKEGERERDREREKKKEGRKERGESNSRLLWSFEQDTKHLISKCGQYSSSFQF
jgi:hypothetical protein